MIQQLISSYDASEIRAHDKATLCGTYPDTPPLARHIVFDPMRAKVKRALISDYKLSFPQALLDIYSSMNGANLFWSVRFIGKDRIRVPFHYLSIYGIPTNNDRKHIEPYNISVEDLNRPKGTPDTWLKFGSYTLPEDIYRRWDLFVDTQTNFVYAAENGSADCCIAEKWDSIDACLCCLFERLREQTLGAENT